MKRFKTLSRRRERRRAGYDPRFSVIQDDKIRSRVIQNLIVSCRGRGSGNRKRIPSEIRPLTSASALKSLAPAAKGRLGEIVPRFIRPTDAGRIFLRNLAMPFDAYLHQRRREKSFLENSLRFFHDAI